MTSNQRSKEPIMMSKVVIKITPLLHKLITNTTLFISLLYHNSVTLTGKVFYG